MEKAVVGVLIFGFSSNFLIVFPFLCAIFVIFLIFARFWAFFAHFVCANFSRSKFCQCYFFFAFSISGPSLPLQWGGMPPHCNGSEVACHLTVCMQSPRQVHRALDERLFCFRSNLSSRIFVLSSNFSYFLANCSQQIKIQFLNWKLKKSFEEEKISK